MRYKIASKMIQLLINVALSFLVADISLAAEDDDKTEFKGYSALPGTTSHLYVFGDGTKILYGYTLLGLTVKHQWSTFGIGGGFGFVGLGAVKSPVSGKWRSQGYAFPLEAFMSFRPSASFPIWIQISGQTLTMVSSGNDGKGLSSGNIELLYSLWRTKNEKWWGIELSAGIHAVAYKLEGDKSIVDSSYLTATFYGGKGLFVIPLSKAFNLGIGIGRYANRHGEHDTQWLLNLVKVM